MARCRSLLVATALFAGALGVVAPPVRAAETPGAVATFTGKPADQRVFLSWTYVKPADFANFEVRRFTPAETPTLTSGTPVYTGPALSATATGLTNGTPYQFAIWSITTEALASEPKTLVATPVLHPTRLSISQSVTGLSYGRAVVLRGVLRRVQSGPDGPLAGQRVRLMGRLRGSSTWTRLATRTTNSAGAVAVVHKPRRHTYYKWVHSRTVFYGGSSSARVAVRVKSVLTANVTSVFTGVGAPVYFKGQVKPATKGLRVQLQRRASGEWRKVGSAAMSSTGRFALPYTPRSSGAHTLRVVKPSDATNTGTVSPSQRVTATSRTLRSGMSGADVLAMQQQLARLHYDVGAVDGRFGYDTLHAVVPFQKVNKMRRDGIVGAAVRRRLGNPRLARMREVRRGRHIEVDLTKQVIMLGFNGRVSRVVDTSSGNGQLYTVDGRTARATTPTGRFKIIRKINGMRVSRLGQLWRPAYFYGGFAIHGSKSVPSQPASHGCLRVTNPAQDRMYKRWVIGTPVWIYRT